MVSRVLEEMITYFRQDVRRVNHALKVYGFARAISGNEALSERQRIAVELAAVLHDIGIKEAEKKYGSSAGKYQEIEGPPIARDIREAAGIEKDMIERVCYLVGNHHSYNKIDGTDFQILVEADFLVNIDEDKLDPEAIKSIKAKYFKTATGIRLLESLYGI